MKTRSPATRFLNTVGSFSVIVLAAALTTVACGGGGKESSVASADAAAGHDLFKRTCATCHGPNGEGMPKLGKNLHANEFVKGTSDAELVEFIKRGRPAGHPENTQGVDMPPKGGNPMLTDADMSGIVVYMRSLQ